MVVVCLISISLTTNPIKVCKMNDAILLGVGPLPYPCRLLGPLPYPCRVHSHYTGKHIDGAADTSGCPLV